MPTKPAFAWPMRPNSDANFAALMNAIDQALLLEGLEPWQRPLHIGRKLWEAFAGLETSFQPRSLQVNQVSMALCSWQKHMLGTSGHTGND